MVSGLLFEGNEALLLELGRIRLCDLVTAEYVVDEVKRVLRRSAFRLSTEEQAFLMSYLHRCLQVYPSPTRTEIEERADRLADPKDIPVLASYEALQCDFLATGDGELLTKVHGARRTKDLLRLLLERAT